MASEDVPTTTDQYDQFVSAEIPSAKNPVLRELVLKHMVHGPCGALNPSSPCMENGACSKGFPKKFSPVTVESDESYHVYQRGSPADGGETSSRTLRSRGRVREKRVLAH